MAITFDPRFVIELQPARHAPATPAVYRRRRLVVMLALVSLVAALGLGGHTVLADRGGAPASASTVSPAQSGDVASTYVVQRGDSLWSIAREFSGSRSIPAYVDALIDANGGSTIFAGSTIVLP